MEAATWHLKREQPEGTPMSTNDLPSIDEDLLAEFERKFSADLADIEQLKAQLEQKQSAFRARHERVLSALARS
jgi:hypothetical protein